MSILGFINKKKNEFKQKQRQFQETRSKNLETKLKTVREERTRLEAVRSTERAYREEKEQLSKLRREPFDNAMTKLRSFSDKVKSKDQNKNPFGKNQNKNPFTSEPRSNPFGPGSMINTLGTDPPGIQKGLKKDPEGVTSRVSVFDLGEPKKKRLWR